ncbi:hypothetical protein E2C01_035447 [Portunus trituberculatus]|uniref:Uncharacterized protein n=1 Tax=Portunus trituberculatus TaxID=210409 RepID=A0A5B7F376_PORTR|nr:hypothetical protein [Portunus trituberculatus]
MAQERLRVRRLVKAVDYYSKLIAALPTRSCAFQGNDRPHHDVRVDRPPAGHPTLPLPSSSLRGFSLSRFQTRARHPLIFLLSLVPLRSD